MALCTTYSFYVVRATTVRAGKPDLMSFYYPYDKTIISDSIQYTRFIRFRPVDEALGYPSLEVINLSGSDYVWAVKDNATDVIYRTRTLYSSSTVPDCPESLSWVWGAQGPLQGLADSVFAVRGGSVSKNVSNLINTNSY